MHVSLIFGSQVQLPVEPQIFSFTFAFSITTSDMWGRCSGWQQIPHSQFCNQGNDWLDVNFTVGVPSIKWMEFHCWTYHACWQWIEKRDPLPTVSVTCFWIYQQGTYFWILFGLEIDWMGQTVRYRKILFLQLCAQCMPAKGIVLLHLWHFILHLLLAIHKSHCVPLLSVSCSQIYLINQ